MSINEGKGTGSTPPHGEQIDSEMLLATMLQGVVYHDADGKAVWMNPAAERILGRSRDELVGETCVGVENPTVREDGSPFPGLEHPAMVTLRTGKAVRDVTMGVFNPREKAYRWINVSAVPVRQSGATRPDRVYALFDDITDRKRAEEAVRTSEERLRLALSAGAMATWDWDVPTGHVTWNDEHFRMLGYEPGDVVPSYHAWAERVHPEDRAATEYLVRTSVEQGADYRAEFRTLRPDGTTRWIEARGRLERDAAGHPLRQYGVMLDITDRKRSEEELTRALSEAEDGRRTLEALMESVPEGITIADAQGVTIRMVSRYGRELLGAPHNVAAAEVARQWPVYRPDGQVMAPEDLPLIRAVQRGELVRDVELVQVNGRGEKIPLLCNAAPIRDGRGAVIGGVVAWRDITERKKAEEALRESEARFRSVLESSRDVIYRTNAETGRFEYIGPACETVVGYSVDELMALDAVASQAMIHPDDLPAMRAAMARLAECGEAEAEYRQRTKDGGYRWLSNRMSLARDSTGRPTFRSGNIRDVTEHKRTEAAQRESEILLRSFFDSPGMLRGIVELVGHEILFVSVNEAAAWLYGRSPAEVCGKRAAELDVPADIAREWLDRYRQSERTGQPVTFELRRATGNSDAWFSATVSCLGPGPTGHSRFAYVMFDVTRLKRVQEELRASERLYRAIGDSIDYGVWTCDPDGRNTYASKSFLELVGLTQEQCSNFGWGDVLHPDDAERTIAAWKECVRAGGAWDIEHRYRGVDGRWHPVLARGVPVKDESGQVLGWVGINLDISHQKQTEERLRENEQQLRDIIDGSPTSIVFLKDVDGRFITINRRLEQLLGTSRDALRGKTDFDIFPPAKAEYYREHDRRILETGEPLMIEETADLADGRRHTFLASKFPLRDASGRLYGIGAVSQDISEVKEAEEKLRRHVEEVETLMEVAPVAIWVATDPQCHDIIGNQAANEFYEAGEKENVSASPASGRPVPSRHFYIDGREVEADELPMQVAAATNRDVVGSEFDVVLPSGTRRTLSGNASPLRDSEGKVRGCIGAFVDVTERKLAEHALREADRRKNEFLGVLSHELRNPLAPIRNGLYILERAAPGGEQARRAHSVIDRQVGHLSHLVDDLLDVTRITRGKIRLQRTRVDLVDVVRRTVEDHRSLLEGRAIALRLPSEPVWIDGDPTRLAQVLGNLLNNAAKFTPDGGEVSVSLTRAGGCTVLEVADTGLGIDPDTQARLFEPFAQADRSLDRSRGGLGLGLALVKGLVDLHGGTVHAHSDGPGRGARFTITLPVDEHAIAAHESVPSHATADRGCKVLVIEDNKDAGDTLSEAFGLSGHRVVVAYDGETGLAKARTFLPDVVVCDIGLPGQLDGYAVARALRRDARTASALLVALTGYAQPEDQRRALDAGFDVHLAKPPDLAVLDRLMAQRSVRGLQGPHSLDPG
jgi:PAS domain S-box-containing protein